MLNSKILFSEIIFKKIGLCIQGHIQTTISKTLLSTYSEWATGFFFLYEVIVSTTFIMSDTYIKSLKISVKYPGVFIKSTI